MPREVRFTVRMSHEEHEVLEELQARHDRDRGSMIRWLIKVAHNVGDVVNRASTVRQLCVNDASIVRQLSGEKPPGTDPALQSTQKEEKKNKKRKEPELAPRDVTKRILSDLNKRAGSNFQAKGKVAPYDHTGVYINGGPTWTRGDER